MKELKTITDVVKFEDFDVQIFKIHDKYNRGKWRVVQTDYGWDLSGFDGENQITIRMTSGQDKGWAVVILEMSVDNSNTLPIHHFDHTMEGYEKTWNIAEDVVLPELNKIMKKYK